MIKKTIAILFLICAIDARADFNCQSADGQSDLRLTTYGLETFVTVHSAELSEYARIGYNIELGRLELVKELGGAPVFTTTANGFTALMTAPASGRPDLTWFLEFTRQGSVGHAELTSSDGPRISMALNCQ